MSGGLRRPWTGTASAWHCNTDEAFVNAEIVDPDGGFRDGAVHALKAAVLAHGQWPSHLSPQH